MRLIFKCLSFTGKRIKVNVNKQDIIIYAVTSNLAFYFIYFVCVCWYPLYYLELNTFSIDSRNAIKKGKTCIPYVAMCVSKKDQRRSKLNSADFMIFSY